MGLIFQQIILNDLKTKDFPHSSIILDRVETYGASTLNCYAFCRSTDSVDGCSLAVGNMVGGFPFEVEGVTFQNSGCAYIAGERHADLQKALYPLPCLPCVFS